VFLDQFKKLPHLIEFRFLSGWLDREGTGEFRVSPNRMAALGSDMLEAESAQEFLEVAKRDWRAGVGEQASVELVDACHGCLVKVQPIINQAFSGVPTEEL
jgi:hypothetical protein